MSKAYAAGVAIAAAGTALGFGERTTSAAKVKKNPTLAAILSPIVELGQLYDVCGLFGSEQASSQPQWGRFSS